MLEQLPLDQTISVVAGAAFVLGTLCGWLLRGPLRRRLRRLQQEAARLRTEVDRLQTRVDRIELAELPPMHDNEA